MFFSTARNCFGSSFRSNDLWLFGDIFNQVYCLINGFIRLLNAERIIRYLNFTERLKTLIFENRPRCVNSLSLLC